MKVVVIGIVFSINNIMVYFPKEILKLILEFTDDRLERKQKNLHAKMCGELLQHFKDEDDIDYQYFIYTLFNYHHDIAGNVYHYYDTDLAGNFLY